MQLSHRPPMAPEEVELIKAKTRQTNLWTWLASLNMALLALIIGLAESDIARYYTLSDDDLAVIKRQHGNHNRLGFAVQLCPFYDTLVAATLAVSI